MPKSFNRVGKIYFNGKTMKNFEKFLNNESDCVLNVVEMKCVLGGDGDDEDPPWDPPLPPPPPPPPG